MTDRRRTPPPARTTRRPATAAERRPAAARPPAKRPTASRGPAPRADARAGRRALDRVDGARGQRDGRTATANRAKARNRRRLVGGLAATVILVGVLFVAVFPVNTYRTQRTATSAAEAELREVEIERARVKRAADLLETDAEIERRAREIGYHREGEDVYNILPAPTEPIGLPDAWPFTGVERVLSR